MIFKMSSLKFSKIFVVLFSLSSSLFTLTNADPTYLYHICSGNNFTGNSTYQTNLNLLLTSLPSNANRSDGFSNTTAGQDPNRVYGLFQCRGDVTTPTCQDCVAFASTDATQRCPAKKRAVIWYDECLVHYSDSYIFSTAETSLGVTMWNTNNITIEPSRFRQLMLSQMNEAATQAVNDPKKFATRMGNSTTSQTLYTLVQCTQDLSNTACLGCLQQAISGLPNNSIGGRKMFPSCICRYELYPFYNENLTLSTPPPALTPSPPSPETRPKVQHYLNKKKRIKIIAVVSTITGIFILVLVLCIIRKKTKNRGLESREEEEEVPLIDMSTIAAATNNFSQANMIGKGGFGPVYKGNLLTGQEIAVKRLSNNSRQGVEEFKSEVVLIGKLQHRNLVGLLGSCIQGDERMLIYEYMPNKSLDYFIFDDERSKFLSWRKRFDIIIGIARGLLYLHQDSKLQIIHRDLKASNILLDNDLNPKISDFGLARIFRGDDKEAKTKRIAGTYGYMSPEYAIDGKFSLKSDVFSFGVLLLEIVSGNKNRGFRHPDHHLNLLGHAWVLWNNGRALEVKDVRLEDSFNESQVLRCMQVGLLCVQMFPEDRPEMSSVVFMLANEGLLLPQPKQPGFFTERGFIPGSTSSSEEKPHTQNAMSITTLDGR